MTLRLQPSLLKGLELWAASDHSNYRAHVEDAQAHQKMAMERVIFSAEVSETYGAHCLDGTPSGFYYREGSENESIVIFLQGGGLCVTPSACHSRATGQLGSSKSWPPTRTDESNLLSRSHWNPFGNWSHVFVPYCSGDLFLGTQRRPNGMGLRFSGHNSLEATVALLLNMSSLRGANQLLLAGESAGGIGVLHHADWLVDTLRHNGVDVDELRIGATIQVSALPAAASQLSSNDLREPHVQAGAFLVNNHLVSYPERASLHINLEVTPAASIYLIEFFGGWGLHPYHEGRPYLDASCVAANPLDPAVSCWSAAAAYAYIRTPLYLAQNRFDADQAGKFMGLDWWPFPTHPVARKNATQEYTRYFGRETISGIVNQVLNSSKGDGLFVPSCFEHTTNLCMQPTSSKVRGVLYSESLWNWFEGTRRELHQLVDDCLGDDPCNLNCRC